MSSWLLLCSVSKSCGKGGESQHPQQAMELRLPFDEWHAVSHTHTEQLLPHPGSVFVLPWNLSALRLSVRPLQLLAALEASTACFPPSRRYHKDGTGPEAGTATAAEYQVALLPLLEQADGILSSQL